jgi:hypothetical protein
MCFTILTGDEGKKYSHPSAKESRWLVESGAGAGGNTSRSRELNRF